MLRLPATYIWELPHGVQVPSALGLLDDPLTTNKGFGQKPDYWSTDLSFGVQF